MFHQSQKSPDGYKGVSKKNKDSQCQKSIQQKKQSGTAQKKPENLVGNKTSSNKSSSQGKSLPMARKEQRLAQLKQQQEDVKQNKPLGMSSTTYLQLKDSTAANKIIAQAKFTGYKKSQIKQLKQDKYAKTQFNSKVNQFERTLAQRKIDYGSDAFNQLASEYFPGFNTGSETTNTQPAQKKGTSADSKGSIGSTGSNSGLPDNLKSGIENLSGIDVSDVKVHRNSDKPAQIQAHAFTQGSDIHVAPGQEKHLPHEAWHVVQQKQGRVAPTAQIGDTAINDNAGLENEADVMGAKALSSANGQGAQLKKIGAPGSEAVPQRKTGDIEPVSMFISRSEKIQKINLLVEKYNRIPPLDNNFRAQHKILIQIVQLINKWGQKYGQGPRQEPGAMPHIEALSVQVEEEIRNVERQAGPRGLEKRGMFKSTPALRGDTNKDKATTVGDVASVGHGLGSATAAGTRVYDFFWDGDTEAISTIGVIGEVLGYVGMGLAVFGIAENAVRARDAKIRLGVFAKAVDNMREDDPLRPYLEDAAKQQSWETKRRWVRVAVTSIVLGLSIAALAVGAATTGGIILGVIGGVLGLIKGIETVVNIYKKYKAKKTQKENAMKILEGIRNPAERVAVLEMLDGLGIPRITVQDIDEDSAGYKYAVDKLAPHLGRAETAHREALQDMAEQRFADINEVADDLILQDEQERGIRPAELEPVREAW